MIVAVRTTSLAGSVCRVNTTCPSSTRLAIRNSNYTNLRIYSRSMPSPHRHALVAVPQAAAAAVGAPPLAAAVSCAKTALVAMTAALEAVPWAGLALALAAGLVLGLAMAKAAVSALAREVDPDRTGRENAALRTKLDELQQLLVKLEPMSYKGAHAAVSFDQFCWICPPPTYATDAMACPMRGAPLA